jgi:hypothetical protein
MATLARGGNETGSTTIGTRKSAPIVFTDIVSGDRGCDAGRWLLRRSGGGIEGITSALRPTIRASHRPTLGTGSVKDGATASIAAWCEAEDGSAAGERVASGAAFSIFWITNLWRGECRDDMTLNRAPFIEHLRLSVWKSSMKLMTWEPTIRIDGSSDTASLPSSRLFRRSHCLVE